MNIKIVYWSGTGNTELMAKYISEGCGGKLFNVSGISAAEALDSDVLVLGCSAMGDEVLEETEFEPFMTELEPSIAGKKVALFGSYDWGDGQWMRDWAERIKKANAELIGEPLIVNNTPEGEDIERCKKFGEALQ